MSIYGTTSYYYIFKPFSYVHKHNAHTFIQVHMDFILCINVCLERLLLHKCRYVCMRIYHYIHAYTSSKNPKSTLMIATSKFHKHLVSQFPYPGLYFTVAYKQDFAIYNSKGHIIFSVLFH